jgi:hypothetical protein
MKVSRLISVYSAASAASRWSTTLQQAGGGSLHDVSARILLMVNPHFDPLRAFPPAPAPQYQIFQNGIRVCRSHAELERFQIAL